MALTVDVSQWRGAHSFGPCFVNILEHSECSSGSPGALYVNIIILYMDIYARLFLGFFSNGARCLLLILNVISSYLGTIGRLGELILM